MLEKWLKIFNREFENYSYIPYSMFRPNKNILQMSFLNLNNEEVVIKLKYRENFHFTWNEFISQIKQEINNYK